ncbi:MAG: hypothetical protein AAFR35_10685 [Pseudomonadota bacterium]
MTRYVNKSKTEWEAWEDQNLSPISHRDELAIRRSLCARDSTELKFLLIAHVTVLLFFLTAAQVSSTDVASNLAVLLVAVMLLFGALAAAIGFGFSHVHERSIAAVLSGSRTAHNYGRAIDWVYQKSVPGRIAWMFYLSAIAFFVAVSALVAFSIFGYIALSFGDPSAATP